MIPLGLYRTEKVNYSKFKLEDEKKKRLDIGPQSNKENIIKYVVTNPHKEKIILRESDLVFVLAQSDPGDPSTWQNYNYFSDEDADFERRERVVPKGKLHSIVMSVAPETVSQFQNQDDQMEIKPLDPSQG